MLYINGIPCHETGCPNSSARWDGQTREWVKPIAQQARDYHKEIMACLCSARGHVKVIVKNEADNKTVTFRCKPATDGTVILYPGNSNKQYSHLRMTFSEWAEWAETYSI